MPLNPHKIYNYGFNRKPAIVPATEGFKGPLPKHKLGDRLSETTVAAWEGSERFRNFLTGYWDWTDREGRLWTFLGNVNRLLLLKDSEGNQWSSPIKDMAEGQPWDDSFWVLAEAGFISNNFKEPKTGHFGLVQKDSRKAFLMGSNGGAYKFHQLPDEAFIPVDGLYLTLDQAMSGLYEDATYCHDCERVFRLKKDPSACKTHFVCSECVINTRHTHCKTCSRQVVFQIGPNPDPDQLMLRAGCKACGKCFNCSRECVFCPPKDGATSCRTCCKGEHYDEPEKVTSPHILAYNFKEYPPPRPPMTNRGPKKCEKCLGAGVIRHDGLYEHCVECAATGYIYSKEPQGLYLGVELEVEVPRGLAIAAQKLAVNYKSSIILKADSTIHHGFEIVTAPLSLEEQENLWATLSPEAVKNGCRSWNYTNTGLHIHTNKRFYSQDDICKLNVFINEPAVKDQIIKIAGRESYYAALKPKTMDDGKKLLRLPHREALNINPPQTIELRIFKGTLALEHILADLQFMHAAAHWVKGAKAGELSNWESFWYFVTQNGRYRELVMHFNRQVEIERANKEQS